MTQQQVEQIVIEQAARVELDRARARIAELEGQLAARPSKANAVAQYAMRWAFVALMLVAAAAFGHRLLMWGWP